MSNIVAYSKYSKELQDGIRADLDQEVIDRAAAVSAEASARASAIAAEETARDAAISSAVAAETSARNTAVAAANAAASAAQQDADAAQASADAAAAAVTAEATARANAISAEETARDAAIASAVSAEQSARAAAVSAEASARASDIATLTAAIEAVEGGASGDTAVLTARVADLETEVGANLKDTINSHLSDAVIQSTLDAYLATDSELSGAVETAVADRITNADDIKTKVNAFIAKFFDAYFIEGVDASTYLLTLESAAAGGGDTGGGEAPAPAPAPASYLNYTPLDQAPVNYDPANAFDLTSAVDEASALVFTSQLTDLSLKIWYEGGHKAKLSSAILNMSSAENGFTEVAGEPEWTFYFGNQTSSEFKFKRHPTDDTLLVMGGLYWKLGTDSIRQVGADPSAAPTGATQYFDYDITLKAIKDAHADYWSGTGHTDNLKNLPLRVYLDAQYAVVGVWNRFSEAFLTDNYQVGAAPDTFQYKYNASLKWLEIIYWGDNGETSLRMSPVDMIQHTEMQKVAVHKNYKVQISSAGTYSGLTGWVAGSGEAVKVDGVSDFYLEQDGLLRHSANIYELVQL